MKRTPLKRKSPMSRGRHPMRRRNAKRMRVRRTLCFGPQADMCRLMPCCACVERGLPQRSKTEAHHEPTRARGGVDEDTLPLCHDHHRRRHAVGVETFWREIGINPDDVVAYMRSLVASGLTGEAVASW